MKKIEHIRMYPRSTYPTEARTRIEVSIENYGQSWLDSQKRQTDIAYFQTTRRFRYFCRLRLQLRLTGDKKNGRFRTMTLLPERRSASTTDCPRTTLIVGSNFDHANVHGKNKISITGSSRNRLILPREKQQQYRVNDSGTHISKYDNQPWIDPNDETTTPHAMLSENMPSPDGRPKKKRFPHDIRLSVVPCHPSYMVASRPFESHRTRVSTAPEETENRFRFWRDTSPLMGRATPEPIR